MAARIPRIEDLLSHVLERTMRAVSAGIGSIMLLDRERRTLRIAVGRGLQETGRGPVEVKVGEGIAGKVVEMGEAVVVEDIEKDPRFGQASDPRYGGGSFICMPLRVAERIVGVVNLSKKEVAPGTTGVFSQTDLQFLNALATYTAYAVDNARLFEEAQQAAQRLQEVVEDQKLRLTLAQQQMIQAAKLSALGELVAGVAHELNNPLTVLVGASDILEQQAPEALKEYAQMIRESTDAARHIVRGLLTFGRQMPLERRHVMLDELIEKVLSLTAADLRIETVKVDRDHAADDRTGPTVRLEGKRILIVEHDQAVQKILLEHLEPTGCTALTVARADEARQHLRDGIDLVVADFNLDGVDWLELLGQVAARGAAVGHRFIFITAGP